MESQYKIEVHVQEVDDKITIHEIGLKENWTFEQAKGIAGSFFVGGFVYKEDEVSLAPNFTLYGPYQIKKVRLVAKALVQ